jgi:hypothetical protein
MDDHPEFVDSIESVAIARTWNNDNINIIIMINNNMYRKAWKRNYRIDFDSILSCLVLYSRLADCRLMVGTLLHWMPRRRSLDTEEVLRR